jgi:hypothetical protein
MQPLKVKPSERSNCWKPVRKVWFQKNDDKPKTKEEIRLILQEQSEKMKEAMSNIGFKTEVAEGWRKALKSKKNDLKSQNETS